MSAGVPRSGDAHVVVVGAGIVGLATARALLLERPDASVTVVDKEPAPGRHQSGHSSGVLHSGLYYPPGSAKARLCTRGRRLMLEWCADAGVDVVRSGKVVVAADRSGLARLDALARRGEANGLSVERLGPSGLAALAPYARGAGALWVPETALVDYAEVTRRLADEVRAAGGVLRLGEEVASVREDGDGVTVHLAGGALRARHLVACAGLQSDRLAASSGLRTGLRIVGFRGEYHSVVPSRRHLVPLPIYPVPDPSLPFLGVHLTPHADGSVSAGPNAVLSLGRERYQPGRLDAPAVRAAARLAADPALWRMARRWWRAGVVELARSRSDALLVRSVRGLVPDLGPDDLVPAEAGIRAQAVADDGTLLDDFALRSTARTLHVLNAPSPAATASLAIGEDIARRLLEAPAG